MELKSKYGIAKVFAKTIEDAALSQIVQMINSPIGENSHTRIMPDCHAGKGCVIGTTMKITDKVCPNLVGVDIGCGVLLMKTDIDFTSRFEELDRVIRENIPYGMNSHLVEHYYDFTSLRCWDNLKSKTKIGASYTLGSLGGGNHFIEAYENGFIAVHSGSRNIGYKVAEYYQSLAEKHIFHIANETRKELLQNIDPKDRQQWLQKNSIKIDKVLSYLENQDMADYLHDIAILQKFASDNRRAMLDTIIQKMNGTATNLIVDSIHNYIDVHKMILRKGAISAQKDELLVIPLNMRDGVLICRGKGNEDWNCSAPHGAGRLFSRSEAKRTFSVEEYAESMKGIFTTCINENTLDEAPFVYKNYEEIMECIIPTVTIEDHLLPIFNFKAN